MTSLLCPPVPSARQADKTSSCGRGWDCGETKWELEGLQPLLLAIGEPWAVVTAEESTRLPRSKNGWKSRDYSWLDDRFFY